MELQALLEIQTWTLGKGQQTVGNSFTDGHYWATLIRAGFWVSYNIHTRREIRLLARPQARRPDKRGLTLRRLPRLAPVPGGNTTRSSSLVYSNW
jgi:hypothetical protein